MDYKSNLLRRIEQLVNGSIYVPAFELEFYQYYLTEVPQETLSDYDNEFFGFVQEKLDWTLEDPDAESRGDGFIDHQEYVVWVKNLLDRYKRGEPLDLQ
jgi:hypothetical protein